MMNINSKRGFTLIELLVVVAIIGILASVVLASLNSARNKGADAAIKSSLANTRAQAELFYDTGTTYEGVCGLTAANTIGTMVRAAESAYDGGATTYADGTASTWDSAQCHDASGAWVAWVPLKASTSSVIAAWCVDSTGASGAETAVIAASATACP